MSDIQPGDVVVGIPEEECHVGHRNLNDWTSDNDVLGKSFRVKWAGTYQGQPSLILHNGGTLYWCAGCFRKVCPADPEFIAPVRRVREPVSS